jgi:putative addiction module component (TIGR02574 family)
MAVTLSEFGLDRLSRAERMELMHALWDSIVAEGGGPLLTDAQREDLERRIAEDDADPDGGIPWEEVRARTEARFRS